MPLYVRIIIALVLGAVTGIIAGPRAGFLEEPAKLILRLLGALAPPLILIAVVNALLHAEIKGPLARRLAGLLLLNTLVAIIIGLVVANVIGPGRHGGLTPPPPKPTASSKVTDPEEKRILEIVERSGYKPVEEKPDAVTQFLENVPRSLIGPFTDNGSVIGVIFIAVAFGLALRSMKNRSVGTVAEVVQTAFDALLIVLHWIILVVPLGVFGIVASIVGVKGLAAFATLGLFVSAVIAALVLQACYYLVRIRLGSWVSPALLLKHGRDALLTAFSTGSSTATMPLTYSSLKDRVGLRPASASMGALVGSNFNNDGTALYEAMSALFISQVLGRNLDIKSQLIVVVTSVAASVGAAGIPEAGLVTMTLVFKAVGLPTEYIALLLTVDWFLDRCRTAINVMGDMNVACLLDGKTQASPEELSLISDPQGSGAPRLAGAASSDY